MSKRKYKQKNGFNVLPGKMAIWCCKNHTAVEVEGIDFHK